jgi:acetoin:2,6-dichlorophenolindophenol oxidoreductase subunit alpha
VLGRGTGLLGGKGGSMHLTSVEHGMMGSYAIAGRGAGLQQMGAPWQNMS